MNNQKLTTVFLFSGIIFFVTVFFLALRFGLFDTNNSKLSSQHFRKPQHNIEFLQRTYFAKNEYYDPKTELADCGGISTPEQSIIADSINNKAYKIRNNGKAIKVRQKLINCKTGQDFFLSYYSTIDDLRVLKNPVMPMFNSALNGIDNFFIPEQEADNDFELSLIFENDKVIKFPKFNLLKELNLQSKLDTNKELGQIKFISPDNKLILYLTFIIN